MSDLDQRSRYERVAAQFSAIFGEPVSVLDVEDAYSTGYEGFRVKTLNGYHADVLSMLAGWRLTLVPVGAYEPVFAGMRFWCFEGKSAQSLALAMGQARLFDGSEDWAPCGFSRGWDESDLCGDNR